MSIRSLPPSWAMGALALHSQGDPHIVEGCHYRLYTDPRLGLPLRPIHIWRHDLGRDAKRAEGLENFPPLRHDITWVDSRGRVVVAPFVVTPDNPVTGTLPTHGLSRCVWLRVGVSRNSELRADIFRNTLRGQRMIAARDQAPLSLGASDIDGVVVLGSGVVQDLTWLDIWRYPAVWDNGHQMGLPRDNKDRYLDPQPGSSLLRAAARVARGAPARLGLHDDPAAVDAAAATLASPLEEAGKLDALAPMVAADLDALLDDLSAPQHALERSEELSEGAGSEIPEATWKPTDLVHAAMHDPTMARWLGFMDVELATDFEPDPDHVVMYQMTSWWAIDPAALSPAEQVSFLPSIGGYLREGDDDGPDGPTWDESPDGLPIYRLWVPGIVVGHRPPLGPAAPMVGPERAPNTPVTPDGLGPWLPAEPPDARRQATIHVSGLGPGASVAFATESDGVITGMNERVAVDAGGQSDRALLLVPSVPDESAEPDAGLLVHRHVPADGLIARVAQADPFGRWSDWGETTLAAKSRPAPPEPVFDLWYTMADPDGAGDGALWGTLDSRVQVPPTESLAPGAHSLERIRLTGEVDHHAFAIEVALSDPQTSELVVTIPPPDPSLLAIGQIAEAVTTAVWIDVVGAVSARSAPRIKSCVDPRAPEVVSVPPVLDWTARPDVNGRARLKLTWSANGAQSRFRIFTADEQRLRLKAEASSEPGFAQFLIELNAATSKPERAQALRNHHHLFEKDWFENLTDEAIVADGSTGLSFQHELSGSLGVLAVYKIVAETEGGVPADFAATPLWVWAVPERAGPPQPLLEIVEMTSGPPVSATLRLRLTGDETAATRYRLRRSVIHSDARRMPVAQEDNIVLTLGEKYADIVDTGAFVHDPAHQLHAGRLYSWRVEVQSPALPGSTRPGAWSRPSAAVASKLIVASDEGQGV